MPPNHQAVVAFRSFDGSYYRWKSKEIGPCAETFVKTLLEKADFEEQAYKSCMGIISFARTYGDSRLEKACRKALMLQSVTYTTVRNILKNGTGLYLSAILHRIFFYCEYLKLMMKKYGKGLSDRFLFISCLTD